MIELRWVEKTHAPEHDGATGFTYKVLQYRHQTSDDYIGPSWSEWIDVPTVREG